MTELTCDDCGEVVTVEKRSMVGLLMTCGCDRDRTYSIKTALAIPAEWSK